MNNDNNNTNQSVYNTYGMFSKDEDMKCGKIERVKCGILRWFGQKERMLESEKMKRMYTSKVVAVTERGRPPVKWEDRMLKYVRERSKKSVRGLEDARRECKDRNKWRLFCRGHPLGQWFSACIKKKNQSINK